MSVPGDPRPKASKKLIIISAIVLVAPLFVWFGWDLYVGFNDTRGETLSEEIAWAAIRSLTFPFAVGYLMGHLFWPSQKRNSITFALLFNLVALAALLTLDILHWCNVIDLYALMYYPQLIFLPAFVLGHFCWPQVRQV